jgi:xylan 1,4-beta-xylosidase
LTLSGLPGGDRPVLLEHFRIDRDHSNAYEAWKRMGSPQQPTPEQRADLERASGLALLGSPEWVRPEGGKLAVRFTLPRQGVSLLVLDPRRQPE